MTADHELLKRYADGDSDSFAVLVHRYLNLVYFSALRQFGGDSHRAGDISQMVFVDLAKKAPKLLGHTSLIGWLHTATRKAVVGELRKEYRRLKRERMAWQMEQDLGGGETKTDASNLRPVVDELLQKLNDSDREAVSLRFFLGQSFKQIGETLDTTEDAARMRVDRALEKLRSAAARRGIGSTVAMFTALLEAEGQLVAPESLARSIAQAASSGPSV